MTLDLLYASSDTMLLCHPGLWILQIARLVCLQCFSDTDFWLGHQCVTFNSSTRRSAVWHQWPAHPTSHVCIQSILSHIAGGPNTVKHMKAECVRPSEQACLLEGAQSLQQDPTLGWYCVQ
jgi:hypothetical protein